MSAGAARLPVPPLLVVTDRRRAARPLAEVAEAAFAAGCRWLSIREKDMDPADRLALARALGRAGARWGAVVGVHGDPAAARAAGAGAGAGALHLPRDGDIAAARRALPPGRFVGISAHNEGELARAAAGGADYATLSPVFASPGKPGYAPLGLARFAALARESPVPVLALGGVTAANAARCVAAGAAGVAVMGAVMSARDPGAAVAALLAALAAAPGGQTPAPEIAAAAAKASARPPPAAPPPAGAPSNRKPS